MQQPHMPAYAAAFGKQNMPMRCDVAVVWMRNPSGSDAGLAAGQHIARLLVRPADQNV